MFYAKSTNGFYIASINGDNIPEDAVEITEAEHATLLEGQSLGKVITADGEGRPILIDPPAPTDDYLKARCKSQAKSRLAETDFCELPSVRAVITNGEEMDAYRTAVRALAINPVTNPTFPERVIAVWA
jgi:hypothetical protein